MKKLTMAAMTALLLAGCATSAVPTETTSADSFTTASTEKTFSYGETALTGEALWKAFDSFQLAPSVATVNPDGTPNISVVIPGSHTEYDGNDYFVFGLAENQTKKNLETNGEGAMTVVGGFGDAKGALSGTGARISFTVVTDEDEKAAVMKTNDKITKDSILCKVTAINPLG